MKPHLKPFAAGLAVTLACAALAFLQRRDALELPLLERLERYTVDARFRVRGPVPVGPETAIVVFDDRTLAEEPLLFEKRAGWARLVRKLKELGAKTVGVDALFLDRERPLTDATAAAVHAAAAKQEDSEAGRALALVEEELSGDAQLASALADAGNVALIYNFDVEKGDAAAAPPTRARYGQYAAGPVPVKRALGLVASLPEFNSAARALGFATVFEDETSTVREFPLAREVGGGVYAPMALQALALFEGRSRGQLALVGPAREARLGDHVLPLNRADALWLNFRGPGGSFPTYSASAVVRGGVPAGALAGKLVFVGFTQIGHDRVHTPFSPRFPGVELHATLVDNVLRRDWLTRSSALLDALCGLALGLCVALLFVPRFRLSATTQLLASVGLAAAWSALASWDFSAHARWLPVVAPLGTLALTHAVGLTFAYLGEGVQRARLKKTFARYVGQAVLEDVLAHPEALRLGGERRPMTVLFSDIRDFTTLSEKLAPEKLVGLLNEYLTPMTSAVLAHRGLLDKYIGDAVMAVFGAPVRNDGHAADALSCALDMHRALLGLKRRFEAEGLTLDIGVGVNTGEAVAGNMGSAERFDYTVVGDAVNLASRLEGLTKRYGVFCIVGEETKRAAVGFHFRELDLVQVKGKTEAVAIFELLGAGASGAVATYAEAETFGLGLAHYRAGRLGEARRAFLAFSAANPADKVARLYLARLEGQPDVAPAGFSPVAAFDTK